MRGRTRRRFFFSFFFTLSSSLFIYVSLPPPPFLHTHAHALPLLFLPPVKYWPNRVAINWKQKNNKKKNYKLLFSTPVYLIGLPPATTMTTKLVPALRALVEEREKTAFLETPRRTHVGPIGTVGGRRAETVITRKRVVATWPAKPSVF